MTERSTIAILTAILWHGQRDSYSMEEAQRDAQRIWHLSADHTDEPTGEMATIGGEP